MEQKSFEYSAKFDESNITESNCSVYNMPEISQQPMICPPIQECPQERICHRYICYEVPHIMPCNTKIINHHIYKHTYVPCYSSCEENVVENIYGNKCC